MPYTKSKDKDQHDGVEENEEIALPVQIGIPVLDAIKGG